MGGQAGHHPMDGRVGEDHHLPVREHPGVHAPQGGEAEKALVMAGDDKADFVQVGVQQQLVGVLPSAPAHPHNAAQPGGIHLVHQRPEQLLRRLGHLLLKAAGPGQGAQPA